MGAIADRSSTNLAKVKQFLAINGTNEDADLADMLEEAKSLADQYCDDLYLNADGSEKDIPRHVELWIKTTVARFYSFRENGKKSESVNGVGQVEYGPVDYSGLVWVPNV